jgi:hypothetical protein
VQEITVPPVQLLVDPHVPQAHGFVVAHASPGVQVAMHVPFTHAPPAHGRQPPQ